MKLIGLAARNLFRVQIPLLKFGKSRDEMEADEINKELREILVRMITSREEAEIDREAPGSFGDDFLASLVRAKNSGDPNKRISLEEMVDECKTFYFAGQETLNSSLTWTVYLLALHPHWQDEVRKEVGRVFGQNAPDPEGLAKLKTMGMVINEALRLYPPTAGITRRVQKKAVRLGNVTLPADMNLFIPTLWCHYNPDVWGQDAHRFKPERFAEGIAKATGNNMTAFMPFGLGQRNCVGSSFATAEVKTTLSMILQRFSFSLSPAYVHSPCLQVTLRPQHGVQLILHPL
uniref:Cytochrome P450 n=1 Tax=Kalanchoe fedtschenkoi TaxID=63787 RepID=A0A7N0T601_KALFE